MGRSFSGRNGLGHVCSPCPMPATPLSSATAKLGARVRERRHALGLSQEAVAHQSGLHWTFVGQVERGRRNLSLHNLLKLAAGLDVDPGDLIRGLTFEEPEQPPQPGRRPATRARRDAPSDT